MNLSCNIIRDLLPLYAEHMVSQESAALVSEHLSHCPACQKQLESMQSTHQLFQAPAPMRKWRAKLKKKRFQLILLTAVLACAVAALLFSYFTAPRYLPYSQELLTVSKMEDGAVLIRFQEKATHYSVNTSYSEDGNLQIYHISAWNTLWDELVPGSSPQNALLRSTSGKTISIYYSENRSTDEILLYGPNPNPDGGVRMLPRLALRYYFLIAGAATLLLAVLLLLFRKKKQVRAVLERLLPASLSYLLGQLLVKGFHMESYALSYDLSCILLVSVLFYLAWLFGLHLYRTTKKNRRSHPD